MSCYRRKGRGAWLDGDQVRQLKTFADHVRELQKRFAEEHAPVLNTWSDLWCATMWAGFLDLDAIMAEVDRQTTPPVSARAGADAPAGGHVMKEKVSSGIVRGRNLGKGEL